MRPSTTAALLTALVACSPPAAVEVRGPIVFTGATMGTTYRVDIAELPPGALEADLRADVHRVLESIDARMSTWDSSSELSRFNASVSTDWFDVTEDTRAVVAEAQRVGRLSAGAFDATVLPLVELWGFGSQAALDEVPPESEIAAVLESVGGSLLETRAAPPALRKRVPALGVDLSGLAKGFAVDEVCRCLDDAGARHYLVEVGGELRARGRRRPHESDSPWRVAIERPSGPGGTVPPGQRVIALADRAIATSGDYRDYFEVDGRRYAHVLDPRTGRPVEHGVASATVLAPTAVEADAFATALLVLAPEEGLALARRLGLSVLLILRSGDGFAELETPGFDEIR